MQNNNSAPRYRIGRLQKDGTYWLTVFGWNSLDTAQGLGRMLQEVEPQSTLAIIDTQTNAITAIGAPIN